MEKTDKKIIIAIDGGPGTGKSTVADYISKELNLIHIDTGAIFRSIAYFFIENSIEINEKNVIENLEKIDVKQEYVDGKAKVYLNGKDITNYIRTNEVSMATSTVCRINEVRQKVLKIEHELASLSSVVLDGQDIGTVVFPNADFKFYFVCSMEKRARKRTEDLNKKGENVTYEEVKALLEKRDNDDRTRAIAPISKAKDAIEIDTTNNTVEQTGEIVKKIIIERINNN